MNESRPAEMALYAQLCAEFDQTFQDTRGGFTFDYITGEQATTRANETLGFLNWSFRVLEHGIHAEADECWALGELTVTIGDRTIIRQQFGSQKVKRSRSSGTPLDIGFDLKGAATDALKKCLSTIGIALYLWHKEPPAVREPHSGDPRSLPTSANGPGGLTKDMQCEECGEGLTETRFKDGTNWSAEQLAAFGRRKHSRLLCMTHYREFNQRARQREEAGQR